MKQGKLKEMYGATPERFQRRVAYALQMTEEQPAGRKPMLRTVLIVASLLALLTAAACAAFSSQVTAFFGRLYGKDMQSWLEKGDVAADHQAFALGGVEFTLEEIVYRNNGLYGVGTIRPQDASATVIIPGGHTPDEPYGYDVYGEGGQAEQAPADAPTIADAAKERGAKLLLVRTLPGQIGVDGGAMLSPGTIGFSQAPQRDGSIRYHFELSDAYAVQEGSAYTIQMEAMTAEMTLEGEVLWDTQLEGNWEVEIEPVPISAGIETETETQPPVQPAVADLSAPESIVPEAYAQTGTLPIYRAAQRDFGDGLQPEWFNQSGIASRSQRQITFQDEAVLQWAPEAIFYHENDGVRGALSDAIAGLASSAIYGWPGTHTVYPLEKTALTEITLDEAKETLEMLLAQLGLTGYLCDYALDMSLERIAVLGNDMNDRIASGEFLTDIPPYEFNQATPADEGYYLSYHKPGDTYDQGNGDIFSVYAYVTSRGVVYAAIRDMYIPGEVYETPDTLVSPEEVLRKLPGEIAASRFPKELVSISSVRLTYAPMRARNKADGMVLSPIWLVIYQDAEAAENGYNCWAEFDAVEGSLLNAMFK